MSTAPAARHIIETRPITEEDRKAHLEAAEGWDRAADWARDVEGKLLNSVTAPRQEAVCRRVANEMREKAQKDHVVIHRNVWGSPVSPRDHDYDRNLRARRR